MLDKPDKSNTTASQSIPDPWSEDSPTQSKTLFSKWQFPLDPRHEIGGAPTIDNLLSPEGDPAALQISAHAGQTSPTPTEVILKDELKVDAQAAKGLWDRIRDLFALLLWRGPQDEQAT